MKIRKCLFVIAFLASLNSIKAQDSIFKTNGEVIVSKIMEVTPTEVKYKRINFQDGPTYVEFKEGISKIRYSNGTVDDFKKRVTPLPKDDYYAAPSPSAPVPPAPVAPQSNKIEISGNTYYYNGSWQREKGIQRILMDTKDPQITRLVKKAKASKGLQYIGFLAIPFGVAAGVSGLLYWADALTNTPSNAGVAASVFAVAAVACPILSINFKIQRKRSTIAAVKLYNDKFGNK